MNPIDLFLARSFEHEIKKNLGSKVYNNIEKKLKTEHGISVLGAINDFEKIDLLLHEIFGSGAKQIEKNLAKSIIKLDKSDKKIKIWLKDERLCNIILASYGDPDKKKILNSLAVKPDITTNALKSCSINRSSGYRIFSELVDMNLVYVSGHEKTTDNKDVKKYSSLFNKVQINLEDDKVQVLVSISKSFARNGIISNLV